MNTEDAEARVASRTELIDAIPLGVFAGVAWGLSLVFSVLSPILRNAYIAHVGIEILGFGTSTGAFWTSTIIAAIGTTAFALHLIWRTSRGFPWQARASGFAVGTVVGATLVVLVSSLPIVTGF
ncbi:MAG: hypothetical protein ACE5EW_04275 [Thermoplasmata archaeon]